MPEMPHFNNFAHKLLLASFLGLLLGTSSHVSLAQEDPEPNEEQSEALEVDETITIAESDSNDPAGLPLIIFDPVLIENIELSETDDDGNPLIRTIELSALPSNSAADQNNAINPAVNFIDRAALGSSLAQFEESILQFELEGGVYDYRLSEIYLAMGTNYLQQGEAQLAVDAFSQAIQLSRINNGLFTADQLPIVEALVESYLHLGDIASANVNQEYLLYITQKIYGAASPLILDELLEYADWNLHAASLSLGYIPNIQSLFFRTEGFNENNFIQQENIEDLLSAAAFGYSQAIVMQHDLEAKFDEAPTIEESLALRNSLNFSEEDFDIPDAEQKLAYTYFLQYQFDFNNVAVNTFGEAPTTYFLDSDTKGREALQRRYNYLLSTNGEALDLVKALVDIADWYLVFERWSSAEELYVQAFDLMQENGIDHIDGLISTDLPAYIPSFLSSAYTREGNRLSSDEVLDYEGYIDVSFTISRLARPVSIRIIESSEGTTTATERALISKLRSGRYRRQLDNGLEYGDNYFQIRYYYTDQLPDED